MDRCEYCFLFFNPHEDCDFNIDLIEESIEKLGRNAVWIDEESNLVSDFYFRGDHPLISSKRKINYCPMCGRKLVKGE